ncbi:MAG: carboxylating nicotinate-nucleotide diphosphorylase [Crenarchaeota archaeon]|nr:carboxylating nicotinate-nucleotide diphosphorylase [Thermoproteota archaeon]
MITSIVLLDDFLRWLREDAPFGDYTTDILFEDDFETNAYIVAKSQGLLACVEDILNILTNFNIEVKDSKRSGEMVNNGDVVARLRGPVKSLLMVERTMLNLLMYLSGIATTTRMFVEAVRKVNPNVKIAATRKIVPGLRYLVKKAVKIGGGDTHRFSLSDAVLIKDNHVRLVGSIRKAVELARRRASFIHKVEIEVSSAEEALEAALAGADVVMLDNVSPREVERCVDLLTEHNLRSRVIVEVSGGITLENVIDYAKARPDIISTSQITMRPYIVDMSLEVEK